MEFLLFMALHPRYFLWEVREKIQSTAAAAVNSGSSLLKFDLEFGTLTMNFPSGILSINMFFQRRDRRFKPRRANKRPRTALFP